MGHTEALPAVSVLIPMFNAESTIESTIRSVLAQTMADFEIVVVDDGSTDNSGQLVNLLAATDHRIRLLRQPTNQGIVAAMNFGLGFCRAPLIARLDADDRWMAHRLSDQVVLFGERSDVVLAASGYRKVDESGHVFRQVIGPRTHAQAFAALLLGNCLVHSAVMYRADAVRSIGGYDPLWFPVEDYDLWIRLLTVGRFAGAGRVAVDYHSSESGISSVNQAWQEDQRRKRSMAFFSAIVGDHASHSLRLVIENVVQRDPIGVMMRRDAVRLFVDVRSNVRVEGDGDASLLAQLNSRIRDVRRVHRYALIASVSPSFLLRALLQRVRSRNR